MRGEVKGPAGTAGTHLYFFTLIYFIMDIRNENDMREIQKSYAQVQARFWSDNKFRSELEKDPKAVLKQEGIIIGDVDRFEVVVNDSQNAYLVLPAQPANISKQDMDQLAAAGTLGTAGTVGSAGTFCGCAATFGSLGTFGSAEL